MKKVLLTGASGFIGRHCIPFLKKRNFEIHAISRKILPTSDPDVYWHEADLLDIKSINAHIKDISPTHLLNLAWITAPGAYTTSLENCRWLQSGIELNTCFVENGGQRIVTAGSCFEYDWSVGYCSEKDTPIKPATLYGTAKHSLNLVTEAVAREKKISSAWGRVFFLYGPNESPERLVSYVITSLIKNEVARCSHGNQIRDYLFIEDAGSAFAALLDSCVEGPVNIASGKPITLKEITMRIGKKFPNAQNIHLGEKPTSPDETPLLVAETRRLNDEVGWLPSVDINTGLEKTINWWKKQLLPDTN
jgi:nucleoside-diphosphate-sugar epimerase